ncbi:Dedicator of cytokinesis protein 1 [Armadillidium nasatum]|uniref:Dedicator of cytokinesis protein 1 n=1 Tax=Armadillidium nasatum TaxID=96803 RepID=A0A5N5TGD2_9CRUS|nr:Dedicator of cytokinesis protein 1 [Armadillidium nasatum]
MTLIKMHWKPVNNKYKYGVEGVNKRIFPRAFIHIKECIVDRTGQHEVVTPRIPPIIQELTAALREWGLLIRNLYVKRSPDFEKVYKTMNELISDRKRMLSGQLLVDEMKQIKHQITDNIDLVNRLLGLDLVVRDEQGNILNPDITSTVKLFRHHVEATEKLKRNEEMRPQSYYGTHQHKPHNAWTIMLSIENIILKVPDPCEVRLAFYMWDPTEGKEGREKPLTEPYVFNWTPKGYNTNTELYSNLVAFFTDLSSRILMQDKQIYLMGTVVREGSMATKEADKRTSTTPKKASETDSIRRPFGIFVMEVSEEIRKQRESSLQNNILNVPTTEIKVPFYSCGEKESLDVLLKKYMTSRNEILDNSSSLGIWINMSLYNGDIKQLCKENPNYTPFRELPISYPLCMADIVVPGDVRNDLYVTLVCGEFPKVRNVEVAVKVCNEYGVPIPGVTSIGCGKPPVNEYRSVTYHNDPKWNETFKVALPIEEFRKAHLRFTFKHRSTNELKDKNEKPFALSFVKLIQPNGTTLLNMDHELLVYKIDHKKWNEEDSSYLRLPCVKNVGEEVQKKKEDCYSLSSKDSFFISTVFCSTKLTQKVYILKVCNNNLKNFILAELLALLEWGGSGSSNKTDLRRHLSELRNVSSEELIIFLQDTLDVDVIYMAGELNKHESYQSVLDTYIEKNFHATLAYNKLISILRSYIDEVCCAFPQASKTGTMNKAMKCLHYMIKFIIRSRQLFYKLHAKGQETFQESLSELLNSIAKLMSCTSDSLLPVQGLCLKYLSTTIPDIMNEFDHEMLCRLLIRIVNNLKDQRLSPQRLTAMCEITHSQLFLEHRCRSILLSAFIAHIKKLFAESEEVTDSEVAMRKEKTKGKLKDLLGTDTPTPPNSDAKKTEELKLSVKILSDILDIIFESEVPMKATLDNLMTLVHELLRDILSIVSKIGRDDPLSLEFVAVFISLLRQVPKEKFFEYLESFETIELKDNLSDLLMVIKDLIDSPVFPSDWCEMICLLNSVLMKVLNLIGEVIIERMKEPFVDIIWNNFFHTAVRFITQPSLQLQKFTPSKRNKILRRYKDLRRETAKIVKKLWISLGQHKIRFIVRSGNGYSLIGPFLEMTMIPEFDVRRSTIPIFFDMMQCEFYSLKDKNHSGPPGMAKGEEKIKAKFDEFERDMLENLDHLIEGGCADDHYREVFIQLMKSLCKEHTIMSVPGMHFVDTIGTLMEKLLQYRTIMNAPDHSPEIRMSCTVSLLDFYSKINRKELYLRYVYKLFDLHCECDNYTEAGYTLQLHAALLSWKHSIIPVPLICSRYQSLQYQDELKEKLYYDIISNYEKGKMWEAALKICKELVQRYEEVTMEYNKLSKLLSDMAKFYENIMDPQVIRPEPEYFRVAYYGRGFPAFLQNKVFIYRGNGFERLSEFRSRILDPFPNAEVMKTLSPPSKEDMESAKQHIQINKVDCLVENSPFTYPHIGERIRQYYQVNHVDTFTYSRPFHRGQKDPDNEFATLWTEKTVLKTNYALQFESVGLIYMGNKFDKRVKHFCFFIFLVKILGVLRCFPVIKETKEELTPLDNAIVTMATNNADVENLIRKHVRNSSQHLDPLTRKVSGIIDAAVMGGIKNYEKAFLTDEYLLNHPEDSDKIAELKEWISKQIPLLDLALEIHGCCSKPIDLEHEVNVFKRQTSQDTGSARSSHYSIGGGDSNFASGLSLPRISLAVSKGSNATLPRGMRLSSGSTPNFRKDKKAFKYLRNRRDSFTVKREPTTNTRWFETSVTDNSTPHASPIELRHKKFGESNSSTPKSESQSFSRPNSLNASIKSTSSITSLDRLSFDSDNGGSNITTSEPVTPAVRDDSPPPLPAKSRNLDPSRNSSVSSSFNNTPNSSYSFIEENDIPPEKPPRPPNKSLNGPYNSPS